MLIGLDETYKNEWESIIRKITHAVVKKPPQNLKKNSVQVLEPYHKLKTSSFA